MRRTRIWVRWTLAVSLIATLLTASTASAQQLRIGFVDSFRLVPHQTSYTATDDLWVWRSNANSTSVQSDDIASTLTFLETLESEGDTFWKPGDQLRMRHRMEVELRPESPKKAGEIRVRNVAVSGRAEGRLAFRPEIGDEVIVSGLTWSGKIDGHGWCRERDCQQIDIQYVLSGRLSDVNGQRNCGDISVTARSIVNNTEQEWTFSDVSGLEPDVVISLRTAANGTTCISGITGDSKTLIGEVTFYYGEEANRPYTLGEPTRVMPGDNVTILHYRDIPVRLLESLEATGDTLWDPAANPLPMTQDMRVEVQRITMTDVQLRGEVRGVFPSGVVTEGWISGEGTCEGTACTIQMIRTFEIFDAQHTARCGAMELAVTVDYVHGDEPQWTFGTDGSGTMTLRDHTHCILSSNQSMGDV